MFKVMNFFQNDDVDVIGQMGPFTVIQWKRDISVGYSSAQHEWFASQMNVRRRQVVCDLNKSPVVVQAGAMQWMAGDANATTGVKGVGDFLGKAMRGAATKESAIKPEYTGTGIVVLEPTYKYLILLDLAKWGGSVVLDDGLFLACESHIEHRTVARSNFSSAIAGGEGLFNLSLNGTGTAVIESPCPLEECIIVDLKDDVLKIDGNMALAWTSSLNFTVERSGKTLLGSAASGEGLVNVYRGSGRVMMSPVAYAG
jgi:uncharacterized protein (AIM24 family)